MRASALAASGEPTPPSNQPRGFRHGHAAALGAEHIVLHRLRRFNQRQQESIVGFPTAGHWSLRFNSDWQGYSELFDGHPSGDINAMPTGRDTLPSLASVSLAPYSALIYSQ
jgi:hypothetical protein